MTGFCLGVEQEIRHHLMADGEQPRLVPAGVTANEAGAVDFLVPPGDIHDVRNSASHTSVSIHV
ncbi:hypothetical protein [Streptomyces goshikiensis]|uniref:hypothetical protein n=1 Tax=Streptomyces goshikiensis TaxID=1942 RepID=UPI00365E797F